MEEFTYEESFKKCFDYIQESMLTSCQIIAFLWGDDKSTGININDIEIYQNYKIHIVYVNDLQSNDSEIIKSLENFSYMHSGNMYNINILYDDLNSVNLSVQNIFNVHYKDYLGYLTIGHLKTSITLYPNPFLNQWSSIAMKYRLPIQFPTILPIIGFSQMRSISSIPCLCRFVIFPENNEPQPLLALLNESLKRLKKSAIVLLEKPDWFAILTSQSDYKIIKTNDADGENEEIIERSVLVLNIIQREIGLGWINSLSDHIYGTNIKDHIDYTTSPSYLLPFKNNFVVPSISVEQLEVDFAKLMELIRNLPEKRESLFKLCERLRKKSIQFSMPGIMNAIVHVLQKEESKDNLDKYLIIQELIYYIVNKITPIEWVELSEVKKEKNVPTKRMNISNLLG